VHLLQSRTDEAIAWLEKGRSAMPAAPGFRDRLAAALCPQRRDRTRRRRARRSQEAERRRQFFEYRPFEAHLLGGAGGPRVIRSHLFRRPAQGGGAGGVKRPARTRAAGTERRGWADGAGTRADRGRCEENGAVE